MAGSELILISEALDIVTDKMSHTARPRDLARLDLLGYLQSGELQAVAASFIVRRELKGFLRDEEVGYDAAIPHRFWIDHFVTQDAHSFIQGDIHDNSHSLAEWDWRRSHFKWRVELAQPSGDLSSHEFAQASAVKVRKDILLSAVGHVDCMLDPTLQTTTESKGRGRPLGSGSIDDSEVLEEMHLLIVSGHAASAWHAATLMAELAKGSSSHDSKCSRIHRKYQAKHGTA